MAAFIPIPTDLVHPSMDGSAADAPPYEPGMSFRTLAWWRQFADSVAAYDKWITGEGSRLLAAGVSAAYMMKCCHSDDSCSGLFKASQLMIDSAETAKSDQLMIDSAGTATSDQCVVCEFDPTAIDKAAAVSDVARAFDPAAVDKTTADSDVARARSRSPRA